MLLRLFIEKKKEFDSESKRLLFMLSQTFDIDPSVNIRTFTRLDIEGVPPEHFDFVRRSILSDTAADTIFNDFLPLTGDWSHFAVENAPGRYCGDITTIKRSLDFCGISQRCRITTAKIIALSGNVSDKLMSDIKEQLTDKKYFVPAAKERPLTVGNKKQKPSGASYRASAEGFIEMNDIEVYQYHRKSDFKMKSSDLCILRDWYKRVGKNPGMLELAMVDSIWGSIRHEPDTAFKSIEIKDSPMNVPLKISLEEYQQARKELYGDRGRPVSINDIAQIGLLLLKNRGLASDIERGDNGSIQIQLPADINGVYDQWMLSFKSSNDNKNAPFESGYDIVGDMLSDRLYTYQAINLTCEGSTDSANGRVPFDFSDEISVAKRADYYSELSVACGQNNEYITSAVDYSAEFTAAAAAAPKTNITRSAVAAGDVMILLGGKISEYDYAADKIVQGVKPEVKSRAQELLKNQKAALMIKRCRSLKNGLFSAVADITDGAAIDCDRFLSPECDVISALCAPCDRAIILCDKTNVKQLSVIAAEIGLELTVAAMADSDADYKIFLKGKEIARVPKALISLGRYRTSTDVTIGDPGDVKLGGYISDELSAMPIATAFLKNLSVNSDVKNQPTNIKYDFSSGAGTVLAPFGGKYQSTPEEALVCKIPSAGGSTNTVTVMSYGCTPEITSQSPFHGAAFSIMESISKIVAAGANSLNVKLALSEQFTEPGEIASKWGRPAAAMLGAFAAQTAMGLAVVDNKCVVADQNNFKLPFNFISFAIAASKSNEIISAAFKSADSTVLLIPMPTVPKTSMPDFDRAKVLYRQFHYLSQSGKILSASVVKKGGVAAAVAKMSFGNSLGVEFTITDRNILFSDMTASIIVETKNPGAFSGMDTIVIGKTTEAERFIFKNQSVSMTDALLSYRNPPEYRFNKLNTRKIPMLNVPVIRRRSSYAPSVKTAKPTVFIPRVHGIKGQLECEYDFENAGGNVLTTPFDFNHREKAAQRFADNIRKSQILMIPDFSEDIYSKNLTFEVFNDKRIKDALNEFLLKKGLILGIGSGFGVLAKLGLFETEIQPIIAPNVLGRRVSQLVRTKVVSVKSPWLSLCEAESVFATPAYHINGRFAADESAMNTLIENGQIATQYVDLKNNPTTRQPFNPNGSFCAVEGITSPDGLVFGKMCHSERGTAGCYVNVPGSKDQRLFEAGINYFK